MHRLASLRLPGAIFLATLVLAQGCSSGGSGSTGTTTGSITLSLSPTSATVQVGGSTTVLGTIVRSSFTGDVGIAVQGVPTGVTGVVNSAPTGGSDNASVTITAGSSATPGTYTITVVASGSGISNSTATFALTISAATSSSYTEALSTSALSIAQGAAGNTTVTYTRSNFTGNITPSVDNLPTGVTAAFSVNPVTGTTSTLTLTVASTVAAGQYSLDVRGVATGLTDVTTPLTLTVTAVAGSYTMALSSSTQSIAQGANANNTVTITRTNFTGSITLSVVNLPTGVTAAFAPNPATAGTSTLTLTVGSSVTAGVYSLTVTGVASGLANVTAPLSLTVTSTGGGGSITVDYSACTATRIPIWVAYQDGTGAWTHITGTGNVYHFTLSSSKVGLAAVTLNNGLYTTQVTYEAVSELNNGTQTSCTAPSGNTVTGTVSNAPAGSTLTVSMGGSSGTALPPLHTYSLSNVMSGTQTLMVYMGTSSAPSATDAVQLVRGVVVPGTPVVNVDFSTASTVQSATFTISGGTTGDNLLTSMAYLTTAACVSNPIYQVVGNYASSVTAYGVPVAQASPTDFHIFTAEDYNTAATSFRLMSMTFHTFAAQTITLPAAMPAGTITTPSGGVGARRQVTMTLPSDYSTLEFTYADLTGNQVILYATPGYLGSQTATLAGPDFSSAGAYLAAYGLAAGTMNTTLAGLGTSGAACTEGATTKTAITTGTN